MFGSVDWSQFKNTGDLFLSKSTKDFLQTRIIGSKTSIFYISYWSIVHLLSGVGTALILQGYLHMKWVPALFAGFLIHTAWEAWQILITITPNTLQGKVDTIVDTLLFLTGLVLGSLFF